MDAVQREENIICITLVLTGICDRFKGNLTGLCVKWKSKNVHRAGALHYLAISIVNPAIMSDVKIGARAVLSHSVL